MSRRDDRQYTPDEQQALGSLRGLEQPRDWTEATGKLEIGLRAVDGVYTGFCKSGYFSVRQLCQVDSQQACVQQPDFIETGNGADTVSAFEVVHFLRGFMNMHVNRQVELGAECGNALQWRL